MTNEEIRKLKAERRSREYAFKFRELQIAVMDAWARVPKLECGVYWGSMTGTMRPLTPEQWARIDARKEAYHNMSVRKRRRYNARLKRRAKK